MTTVTGLQKELDHQDRKLRKETLAYILQMVGNAVFIIFMSFVLAYVAREQGAKTTVQEMIVGLLFMVGSLNGAWITMNYVWTRRTIQDRIRATHKRYRVTAPKNLR